MNTENEQIIKEQVRDIKQSFRLLMNGVTAQSMREKGLDYHLNWGASLLHLQEMASEYTSNHQLAQELWKENIRECKILATMLMPKEGFDYDLALLWIEQTTTQEIAEIATLNLYQYQPYAMPMALMLIAQDGTMAQLHGYTILARLFVRGDMPDSEREINEFLDQNIAALQDKNISLRHSAWNAMQHFAQISELTHRAAKSALRTIEMDEWL